MNESETLPQPDHLIKLRDELRQFAANHDWEHSTRPRISRLRSALRPPNCLSTLEWLTPDESQSLPADKSSAIRLEMADVRPYLVRLADRLGIDLAASAFDKVAINAKKYPVALSKGSSKKYTEL